MLKRPIIIDTDPGVDDTFAILMMAANDKFSIKAMTATHGNVGLEGTSRNALALSEYLNINCPVAKGADKPLIVPIKEASEYHGANGMAGFEFPEIKSKICDKLAWDLIYDIAKEENGKLQLLVLGPMTNIAIAILKYPDLKNYIDRIYMMGGSRDFGNHSQYAEFNIWGDPHACEIVLKSGIKITMADLTFGDEYSFNGDELEKAYSSAKKLKPMMEKFWEHEQKFMPKDDYKKHKMSVYDATAAACMILDGDCLETKDYYVVCETQGSETNGQTVFDYLNRSKKEPNISLAIKMDKEKYYNLFKNAISYFE